MEDRKEYKMKKHISLLLAFVFLLTASSIAYAMDEPQGEFLGYYPAGELPAAGYCNHNWIQTYVGEPFDTEHNGQMHLHQLVLNRCTKCGDYYYSEACYGVT